ncbi:MAG: hypothetical protein IJL41_06790 [Clostridia bacterium]|nr:hypothetical protein [Clostridia bacterium]
MLKNKKGIAIETAVFMMIIIFALCTLIVTITLYSRQHVERAKNDFAERVKIDSIGEQILIGVSTTQEGYNVEKQGNSYIVRDSKGDVVLNIVVEKEGDNDNFIIKRWSCFEEVSVSSADQGE